MSLFEINDDISKARTIHTSFYTSEDYFQLSKEKIFSTTWQFAGSTDYVKEPGSVFPFYLLENFLNEPLVLTKDTEREIHCISNVCTHRGNLLVYKPCDQLKTLTCKYHGRSFQLNGQFKFMPEFKEVEDFPAETDNLTNLPLFEWQKLLFTSLNVQSDPNLFYADMISRFKGFPMEDLVYHKELSRDFMVEAHWALYCENYLEGFHIPFVHAGLNEVIDYGNYKTEIFPYSNLQLGIAKPGEVCFELPGDSIDYGLNIAAYYFWVFPNLMFNFYPWGLSLNIIEPISTTRSKVRFMCFVYDETKMNIGAGADLDTVEFEDEEIVMHVQKGIRSRFYEHGRYSVTREQGTHHFHRLLAQFMNN